ncbi:unnamed protein product [Moneuplotes crassus]|uniref:Uncharacterized protein n=1 Tax=Euplotes crassus TaxID=5936 RepID=A0AAD1Y7Y1_EUPCR|nr:unnamed protein product [Moneuplotes crassus]
MENKDVELVLSPKMMGNSEFEESNQFNFTQKYNQMCRSKLESFLTDCNELYAGFDDHRQSFEKLVKLDRAQNKGRFKRHHIKRRTNNPSSTEGEERAKKVKLYNTLAEFILLAKNSQPKILKFNGDEGALKPKFQIKPPQNRMQEKVKGKTQFDRKSAKKHENDKTSSLQPSVWGEFGSLFFQNDQNNVSKSRLGQHIIEINQDPNTGDESSDNFISISEEGNSFYCSDKGNEESETELLSPQESFFKITSTPLSRRAKISGASSKQKKYIYSNKTINKSKVNSSIKQTLNRNSESQAFWKSHLLEGQQMMDSNRLCFQGDQMSQDPSLDTIKRSLSQIHLSKQRSSYHKKFLSKPSLSISRVNSSAYYKRKGNLTKMKLSNLKKEPFELSKFNRKDIPKNKISKPHTIQHKSTKVHPVKLHKNRIQKEIERAKEAGNQILEKEVLYKYKVSGAKPDKAPSKKKPTSGKNGNQNLLYFNKEEEYNKIMVDYNDKVSNYQNFELPNGAKTPLTLMTSTSNEVKFPQRKVKTPVDPIHNLNKEQRECLRTSGSYSKDSLRYHQNGPLILSKLEPSSRVAHNTNHLKLKEARYPQKATKLSVNICTVDAFTKGSYLAGQDLDGKNLMDSKNTSCLSSPYLNQPIELNNFQTNTDQSVKFMNKTETAGFGKAKMSEATKDEIRNQILDLDLVKLPSISNEYANSSKQQMKLVKLGNSEARKNGIPVSQIVQNSSEIAKNQSNSHCRDEYKDYFNPMLNKTRVDNLPPLQEMSVFEQSFEGRRKQTANQKFRSRSKNYHNLESSTYANGTITEIQMCNNRLEESKSSTSKPYKSPTRQPKETITNCTVIPGERIDTIGDASLKGITNIERSGTKVVVNSTKIPMKYPSNNVKNLNLYKMKNKMHPKCNIGGSILKNRGKRLKNGQVPKREHPSKVINHIPKSKVNNKSKRFKAVRRETIRSGSNAEKLNSFLSSKGTTKGRVDTYSYRITNLTRGKSRGGNRPGKKITGITIPEDTSGNNSARLSSKIQNSGIVSAGFKKKLAGRNHTKNSVESNKIPKTSHLVSSKGSNRQHFS